MRIETTAGPAELEIDRPAGEPKFLLVLTHGSGGGTDAKDLLAVGDRAVSLGGAVALVTQPYRVAGRRAPGNAEAQDAAWVEIIAALREDFGDIPLIQGGRSNGARVACRTAKQVGARGVVALSFPLHPPGKPEKTRRDELLATGRIKVVVVNGARDPFGIPDAADAAQVHVVAGQAHSYRSGFDEIADVVTPWLRRWSKSASADRAGCALAHAGDPKFGDDFRRIAPSDPLFGENANHRQTGSNSMRKITAGLFISIDGVIEDPQDWHFPYFDDEMGAAVGAQLGSADTLLLGRDTYESFAGAWPEREAAGGEDAVFAKQLGDARKIVASHRNLDFTWRNSEQLRGDLIESVTALKAEPGATDIAMSGSPSIVRQLLAAGLLDELHLFVHPIAVRKGARLFDEGDSIPLRLLSCDAFSSGVVHLVYTSADAPAAAGYDDAKAHLPQADR